MKTNGSLSKMNYAELKDKPVNTVILPWGATEAHNYHLPYGTDNYQTEYIALAAAEKANKQGASAIVLPVIPIGVNTGQMDIPFCINIYPSTQLALLDNIIDSMQAANIKNFIILNGHGGNEFKPAIRELQVKYNSVLIGLINWYKMTNNSNWFEEPGDHAGEMETSNMMYIFPELVSNIKKAGDGKETINRIAGFRDGTAWMPRPWTKVSADTGIGNPVKATAVKGEKFLDFITNKIAGFLLDIDQIDRDNLY